MIKHSALLTSAAFVSTMITATASTMPHPEHTAHIPLPDSTVNSYKHEIAMWRKNYEASLRKASGWLTVVGLLWLQEGDNWLGSAPSNTLRLPSKAPATIGCIRLSNNSQQPSVRFFPVTNVPVQVRRSDGSTPNLLLDSSQALMFDDDNGSKPDVISIGDFSMFVVRRTSPQGARFAIRLRDSNSPARQNFKGCTWFPVKPEYRIEAKFIHYENPKIVNIQNILGGIEQRSIIGYAEFKLGKQMYKLDAEQEGTKLFINFRDETSGKITYPAGRFLYTDLPADGKVILDFNKAENPPCAFTHYATCSLPPRQNRLSARIEAGEKTHHPFEESSTSGVKH